MGTIPVKQTTFEFVIVFISLPRQRVIELFDSIENMYKWQTVSIVRFRGIMAFMAPFMKTAFMQNTILMMERFKLFAEGL